MKKLLLILPLVFLLCFTFGCQQGEEGITDEEAKTLFDRQLEFWNGGDIDIVNEIIDPEYVIYLDPHDTYEKQTLDHETYKKRVLDSRTIIPDSQYTCEDIIAKGDKVATRWTHRGTHKATGKQFVVTGVTIYHVVDGKLKGHWQSWDRLGLYMQLGFTGNSPKSSEKQEEKK
jgi:predicted ester cyclase